MAEASVFIYREGKYGGMRNHMVIIVKLDKEYLVDVGFGRSSRYPIPINGEVNSVDGLFRVRDDNGMKIVEFYSEENWHPQYKFDIKGLLLHEFQKNCDWIQSSPESIFTQGRIISKGTIKGRISMEEDFFKLRENDEVRKETIKSEDFDIYYRKYFL